MKLVMIVIALAAVVLFMPAVAFAQKLVFVVRHAERADAGMQAQTDPPLSAAGEARAQKLAAMLADAGVKDIFATEFKRTQNTTKPLAMKTGVAVEVAIADNEYDNLFVVVPATGTMTRIRY